MTKPVGSTRGKLPEVIPTGLSARRQVPLPDATGRCTRLQLGRCLSRGVRPPSDRSVGTEPDRSVTPAADDRGPRGDVRHGSGGLPRGEGTGRSAVHQDRTPGGGEVPTMSGTFSGAERSPS